MEEVVRKRAVGAVVLVVIGIMLPLLLARCLHDPAPDGQAMRVYDITPSGGIEPVDGGMEQAAPAADEAPAVTDDGADNPPATDGGAGQEQPLVVEGSAPTVEPTPEPQPQPEPATAAADAQQTPDTVKSAPETSASEASQQAAAEPAPPADTADLERDAAAGSWIVQVASFGKEQNARALAQQLDEAFTVFYTPAQINGETWYRVRIGPFDSEAAANNAAAELRAQGRDILVKQVD